MSDLKRTKMEMRRVGESGKFTVEVGERYVLVAPNGSRVVVVAQAIKGPAKSPYVEVVGACDDSVFKKAFGETNRERGCTNRYARSYLEPFDEEREARLAQEVRIEEARRVLVRRASDLFPYHRSWDQFVSPDDAEGMRLVRKLCDHAECRRDAKWWESFAKVWRAIGYSYAETYSLNQRRHVDDSVSPTR